MFCPACGLEYQSDATTCTDCGVALMTGPPQSLPEPSVEWLDLDTVLVTGDQAFLIVARSLLEAEGIPSFVRGELLQDFFGWGRMFSGFNFVFGPTGLQVPKERSEEARLLLGVPDVAKAAPTDVGGYHCPRCKANVGGEDASCPQCGAQFNPV